MATKTNRPIVELILTLRLETSMTDLVILCLLAIGIPLSSLAVYNRIVLGH